jgi:hypothetical protein
VSDRLDDIQSRLEAISEELADLALVQLREAVDGGDSDAAAGAAAEERRLTRARRAVDKAAGLLASERGQ